MTCRGSILVTGGAGFLGSRVACALGARGDRVRILDNFDPFYARRQKEANLALCADLDCDVVEGDIRDSGTLARALDGVDRVVHLAALAGVRPSIARAAEYWDVNLCGTQRLFDALAGRPEVPVVFGSSSSVYGGLTKVPFHEDDPVGKPVSPYAATKRAGELCCYTQHHLHGNPVICLRFFTAFGPGQRPEMAIHKFTRHIVDGDAIPIFGDGTTMRDYTYVDDIVAGVVAALDRAAGFRVYNLGGSATTRLADLVDLIGRALGMDVRLDRLPEQPGDVPQTFADTSRAEAELGYAPSVTVAEGVERFVAWYREARERGDVA